MRGLSAGSGAPGGGKLQTGKLGVQCHGVCACVCDIWQDMGLG